MLCCGRDASVGFGYVVVLDWKFCVLDADIALIVKVIARSPSRSPEMSESVARIWRLDADVRCLSHNRSDYRHVRLMGRGP